MKSCIYLGTVRHRRFVPVTHAFQYRLFMMYLDLAEMEQVFRGHWLWSVEKRNIASFRREDHFGDRATPLQDAVRDLVEHQTGCRPSGPIRLLTHLRYFGYCMNPVSFYYCWSPDETRVEAVVAEVHNTPWNQTHCYVINHANAAGHARRSRFQKAFHVSPFMPMNQQYDWRLPDPGEKLAVHMVNIDGGRSIFDATMVMRRRPITGFTLASSLIRFPLMTGQVIAGIYWQALRLRLKSVPTFTHPMHLPQDAGNIQ